MTRALVIIDVQNAILEGKGTPERQIVMDAALERLVERLSGLKANARAAGVPVIVIQHDGGAGHRLATGSDGWRLRPEIAPGDGDVLVRKRASDSFFETDLAERLAVRGITHLLVGGCMTQFCVDTTVRRAVSEGYGVTLLADGHMTADMGDLTFGQIIAHHNATLDGFDAGGSAITVLPASAILF